MLKIAWRHYHGCIHLGIGHAGEGIVTASRQITRGIVARLGTAGHRKGGKKLFHGVVIAIGTTRHLVGTGGRTREKSIYLVG